MKIINYKKKLISLSLILIASGMIISIAGFWMVGFNLSKFNERSSNAWYRTIHMGDGSVSFGNGVYFQSILDDIIQ